MIEADAIRVMKKGAGRRKSAIADAMASLEQLLTKNSGLLEAECAEVESVRSTIQIFAGAPEDSIATLPGFAYSWYEEGRFREAEIALLIAVKISSKVLGERHLDTLMLRVDLSDAWCRRDRFEEAEAS